MKSRFKYIKMLTEQQLRLQLMDELQEGLQVQQGAPNMTK